MPLDLNHVAARLARFEPDTGANAPLPYLDAEGAPTPAFLRFVQLMGFDWLCGLSAEAIRHN